MTPKKQISIRISDVTAGQIEELCKAGNMTQTDLILLAVERLYQGYIVAGELKEAIKTIDLPGRVSLLETDGEGHWTSKELTSRKGDEHGQPG
jgi:hypothetical protein